MISRTLNFLRFFRKNEDGQIAIEFVLLVPILFTAFMSSVELGIYSMRQMWLDRGLDIAVRQVRVNTQAIPSHDALKIVICENAGFIPDCTDSLKLEMIVVDPRAYVGLDNTIDCVDRSLPITSQDPPNYQTGEEHDLMLLRACVKFNPIFPTTGLGFHFGKDGAGQASMTATSAFVQEPGT